jgi:hypothetical protein
MNADRREHQPRKLVLRKETLRQLTPSELKLAAGGWIRPPLTWSCPQPSASGSCPQTEP